MEYRSFSGVETIDRDLWNGLASTASPLMEWEYFLALERSGAVSRDRGYFPAHLVAYGESGTPVGLAPLYIRDRAWVEFGDGGLLEFLSQMTGLPYQFGIAACIPYAPLPAYSMLSIPGANHLNVVRGLLDEIDDICASKGFLSSRIYFLADSASPEVQLMLHSRGYFFLKTQYSMWHNRDFATFEDYLSTFRSSRRTKIRREIRSIREQGIRIRMVPGRDAPASYFDDTFELYQRTWVKHMGPAIRPFLNRDFFRLLGDQFRHRCTFSVAERDGRIVGMALFYEKGDSLYGRYWGCFEEVPFLHFNTCYYHPIDYAIRKGLQSVDPGFGGEHKLIRGFETMSVYHYLKFYGEEQRRVATGILRRMREQMYPSEA